MNWTGGRLHRHAKSNNNSELKAQKQHFARVSLNNLVASRPEASNESISPSTRSLRKVKLRDRRTSETPVQGHDLHAPHPFGPWGHKTTRREITTKLVSDYDNKAHSSDNLVSALGASCREQCAIEPKSMHEMRKELLERPDWLSLSICRPSNVPISSAADMAKIGRPRKQAEEDDRTAANARSQNSNHFTPKVLGKRKRSVEQCDPSEASSQHHEPIPSRKPSSFLSSRILASSPPKRIERSGSIRSSDANTSLSLPPIPLADPDRSTYMLVDDQADPVDFAEELIP